MNRVLSNFLYQAVFQVVRIVIPIITIPIVSNAIGPRGIGIYNYTNSITQYFILFAGLGMGLYGNREVAIHQDNKEELSRIFWELESFSSICSICMLIIYLLLSVFLSNSIYLLVQGMSILAVMFDISWFFMGIEKFRYISLTNLVVQICTLLLIVMCIKNANDTLLYVIIQAGGTLAMALIMWVFIIGKVDIISVKIKNVFGHFKSIVTFFIPQISIVIYTNLNKTILGLLSGAKAVGYFSNGLQISNVTIVFISTLDTVLLPKMSKLFFNHDKKQMMIILNKSLHLQLFFSIPIAGGLCIISDKLVPWFFGNKFLYLEFIIPFLSLLIIIIPMGMSISRQYLLPIGHIKEYNLSVMAGAAISIILNFTMIPWIGIWGAVVGSIVSELFVTITRVKGFMKETAFRYDSKKIMVYVFSTIIMMIFLKITTNTLPASLLTNLIQIVLGMIVYFALTNVLGEKLIINILKIIIKNGFHT